MIERVSGVIEANVDGDRVLLAPSNLAYFGLNPVGARVWDLIGSDGIDMDKLITRLSSEYEVDSATCRSDVDDFLQAAQKAAVVTLP